MSSTRGARRSLLVLVLVTAALIGVVVWPIATALFLAAVFAATLWPIQQRLTRRLGGRRGIAALLLVTGAVIVVGGPVAAFAAVAVQQGAEVVRNVNARLRSEGVAGMVDRLPDPLDDLAARVIEAITSAPGGVDGSVQRQVTAQTGTAAAAVGSAISTTGSMVFQTVMLVIAMYFLLSEGDRLVHWIDAVSPLERGRTLELFREVRRVSSSVIFSSLVTASIQSAAALAGYLIAGVPHPTFVTGLTFVVAFIPAIGAGTVALVVAGFMWAVGRPYAALFLAVWALVVVSLIDNVLRPYLIKGEIRMHGAVVFFALIGGLSAFGAVGLLLGPLIVALFLSALCIYRRDFQA
jgi:predicted PurR-regulated permease PerM